MKQWVTLISILFFLIFSIGTAEAGGSLRYKFFYKDSNGVQKPLPYGMVYLQDGTKAPPMEKYFTMARMFWGSYGNGTYWITNIPAGTYYIRITQRNSFWGWEGPPRAGDYTWRSFTPITITDNVELNLGTLYAEVFGGSGITVTGTVRNGYGLPASGLFVRAQTQPCYADGYNSNINRCGPDRYPALQQTDAAGKYSLALRTPGTYYIYVSTCLGDKHQEYTGNPCMGAERGTIIVQTGETKNFDIMY